MADERQEQSGAFMSGEDPHFEDERGPQHGGPQEETPRNALGAAVQGPEHIMQFFSYEHLPEHLQEISRPFGQLASMLIELLPRSPERTVALRKLLDSKDAAVRARLSK